MSPPPSAPRPASRGSHRRLRPPPWALAAALTAALVLACDAVPLAPGEAALVRWLRMAAEHPLRTGLALALALWALAPAPPPPDDPGLGPPQGL